MKTSLSKNKRELLEITERNGKKFDAYYDPNYRGECEVCGAKPLVRIRRVDNKKIYYDGSMCGPCTWGESETRDPANW